MEWTSLPTIITAIVALYGAGLSTYNLILARNKNKKSLIVSIKIGFVDYFPGGLQDKLVMLPI